MFGKFKKTFGVLFVAIMAVSLIASGGVMAEVDTTTDADIYVDPDTETDDTHDDYEENVYPTIQEAVDNAEEGDVIEIVGGTYYTHVNVETDDLTFNAHTDDYVVVDGSETEEGTAFDTESVDTTTFGDKVMLISEDAGSGDSTEDSDGDFDPSEAYYGIPLWGWMLGLLVGGYAVFTSYKQQ